jgi:hypothetical protein
MCLAATTKRINMQSQKFLINMEQDKPLSPKEKPNNTTGRPIVPFRKVMDGILYVLRTGCQ